MSDDQVAKIAKQLAELNEGFLKLYQEMNEGFLKLYQEMNGRFNRVDEELARKASKTQLDSVLGLLDSIAKQQEIDQHERLAMNHQLDRHERWHHQTADKLDMKLSYQDS